ncbi:hypothetical protein U4E84_00935 [Halorubrum sp. AD140]|uniref:hypothetical protein n=1 Tax=Halorubrum sp. AD140 TaxID=3050073 RepID=UPI002ACC704D|nr:hypothetical protein [Halorubrum sp. AD140]MDZ5809918.1 hypothetical protein [Halorubrum sp. AD140]
MTTPDDTTPTDDTTNRTTDRSTTRTDRERTDRERTADASRPPIPGRTPNTEEAGAPLVPPTRTQTPARPADDGSAERFGTFRRPSRPPTAEERDAPLVPDLRPTRRARTDGGRR